MINMPLNPVMDREIWFQFQVPLTTVIYHQDNLLKKIQLVNKIRVSN